MQAQRAPEDLAIAISATPVFAFPLTHATLARMRTFYTYIVTNESRTLYIGMSSNLVQRMEQHKSGTVPGFTAKYRLKNLVYYEEAASSEAAVNRER